MTPQPAHAATSGHAAATSHRATSKFTARTVMAREALASVRTQPLMFVGMALCVALALLVVMTTTGRAVALRESVGSALDASGTRIVRLTTDLPHGFSPTALNDLRTVSGVTWSAGLGPAADARNAAIPGGAPVAVHDIHSSQLDYLGIPARTYIAPVAYANEAALATLGMDGPGGAVVFASGLQIPVVGTYRTPNALASLGPTVFVVSPPATQATAESSEIVVVAKSAGAVDALAAVLPFTVGDTPPDSVTVQSSAALGELQTVVARQLGREGQLQTMAALGGMALLVAGAMSVSVLLRRRDFGRRRALGATRGQVFTLVVGQSLVTGISGCVVGTGAAAAYLYASVHAVPPLDFVFGLNILALATLSLAAAVPAALAASRDPALELRVA
ncbi:FtsX-like permease family protein [Micrococcales bacterium 31B]|nr:FtsX-like permease family protein [Micrococcales bacterium 31B]